MDNRVDLYMLEGCGRCKYYQTPQCKVHSWTEELKELRRILLDSELKEEFKWSQPTYTLAGKNVVMLTAFKDHAVLSFFKGSLLKDEVQLLQSPGTSSQADRQFRFTDIQSIREVEEHIRAYLEEAIELERQGKKVEFKKQPEPVPAELLQVFDEDPGIRDAFEALTPGRQRGYILHFSQPKNASTRLSRIEKCIPKILAGKGFHD